MWVMRGQQELGWHREGRRFYPPQAQALQAMHAMPRRPTCSSQLVQQLSDAAGWY